MFTNIDALPLGNLLQVSYGASKNNNLSKSKLFLPKKNKLTNQLLDRMPQKQSSKGK